MLWRKRETISNDRNHNTPNIAVSDNPAEEAEQEQSLAPETFPEEEYLKIVTRTDARPTNEKTKLTFNKRDSILQALEGKTVEIIVLNVDIVNSSANVKSLSDEQVGQYYQTFIENTSDLIQDYGGYVLKNAGDCVIGFFPCTSYVTENTFNAVLCGLAMPDMLTRTLNKHLVENKMPEIECRISADFGVVKVIRIRSKDGYSTIDLFGSPMNSAAKILRYARPGQMVIGDDLFWRMIRDGLFEFKLLNRWDPGGKYKYPVYLVRRKQSY